MFLSKFCPPNKFDLSSKASFTCLTYLPILPSHLTLHLTLFLPTPPPSQILGLGWWGAIEGGSNPVAVILLLIMPHICPGKGNYFRRLPVCGLLHPGEKMRTTTITENWINWASSGALGA